MDFDFKTDKTIKDIHIVPTSWFDVLCRYLPQKNDDEPYDAEERTTLLNMIKSCDDPLPEWPLSIVEVIGTARTYEEANLKVAILNKKQYASSNDNETKAEENAGVLMLEKRTADLSLDGNDETTGDQNFTLPFSTLVEFRAFNDRLVINKPFRDEQIEIFKKEANIIDGLQSSIEHILKMYMTKDFLAQYFTAIKARGGKQPLKNFAFYSCLKEAMSAAFEVEDDEMFKTAVQRVMNNVRSQKNT